MRQPVPLTAPISPAVAAFWVRNSPGEREKTQINLRTISKSDQRLRTKRPKLPSKNKGGAPKGNRNAITTGLHTQAFKTQMALVRQVIAQTKLARALVLMEAARKDAQTYEQLRRAGIPRRAIWPCEL